MTIKEIFKFTLKEIASLFTDEDWHFDPWKTAGFILLALSAAGGIFLFSMLEKLPTDKLGIGSGLIATAVVIIQFLFSQSQKNDDSIRQNKKE